VRRIALASALRHLGIRRGWDIEERHCRETGGRASVKLVNIREQRFWARLVVTAEGGEGPFGDLLRFEYELLREPGADAGGQAMTGVPPTSASELRCVER